jgi:hypothetical protein
MREHVAPIWGAPPPGVFFYGDVPHLPKDNPAFLGVVNDDGNADSAGYHSVLAGMIYGLVDMGQSRSPSRTLSHEALEMYGNPYLSRKIMGPRNRWYYAELNDPVQRRQYEIEVTLMGTARKVAVSDFVLPAWFDLPNADSSTARTYLGKTGAEEDLDKFEVAPGGYQITEEADGEVLYLAQGAATMNRSQHGRTNRIVQRKYVTEAA